MRLSKLPEHIALPWLPPFAHKGAPYHRLSLFVLQQLPGETLDVERLKAKVKRERFNLRSFNDKHKLVPVGFSMFRTQWDEGTDGVMQRLGMPGVEIEFGRKKPEKMPYKKKDGARFR